jgi:hypothetical protein
MKRTLVYASLVSALLIPRQALSLPGILKLFTAQYPATVGTQLDSCRTCHLPMPAECLNGYAMELRDKGLDFAAVEDMDADGDGVTNLAEIKALTLPGSQASANEKFEFHTRMGTVTFDHEAHSLDKVHLSMGKCANCHGEGLFPKVFDDNKAMQPIAHKVCRGCHKDSNNPQAPLKCLQCHVRE